MAPLLIVEVMFSSPTVVSAVNPENPRDTSILRSVEIPERDSRRKVSSESSSILEEESLIKSLESSQQQQQFLYNAAHPIGFDPRFPDKEYIQMADGVKLFVDKGTAGERRKKIVEARYRRRREFPKDSHPEMPHPETPKQLSLLDRLNLNYETIEAGKNSGSTKGGRSNSVWPNGYFPYDIVQPRTQVRSASSSSSSLFEQQAIFAAPSEHGNTFWENGYFLGALPSTIDSVPRNANLTVGVSVTSFIQDDFEGDHANLWRDHSEYAESFPDLLDQGRTTTKYTSAAETSDTSLTRRTSDPHIPDPDMEGEIPSGVDLSPTQRCGATAKGRCPHEFDFVCMAPNGRIGSLGIYYVFRTMISRQSHIEQRYSAVQWAMGRRQPRWVEESPARYGAVGADWRSDRTQLLRSVVYQRLGARVGEVPPRTTMPRVPASKIARRCVCHTKNTRCTQRWTEFRRL